jgi:molybdopterin/thiamine biosynthesis adenylyltransferase
LVGYGGIGSNQAKILVQMGFGQIDGIDPDLAEDSNRNRQLFTEKDVGKPKAHQVLKNLEPYAVARTALRGYFMTFEEWAKGRRRPRYDVICCGVDSLPTMVAVATYALARRIPVVYTNISKDGEAMRVFIQRPGNTAPCFACYMPEALAHHGHRDQPCVPVPAIADILQVAVGFGARAAIGEILGLPIGDYNCRDLTFSGFDIKKTVPKRLDCPLCGDSKTS